MGELTLSEDEYKIIGEKFSSAVGNKELMHPWSYAESSITMSK